MQSVIFLISSGDLKYKTVWFNIIHSALEMYVAKSMHIYFYTGTYDYARICLYLNVILVTRKIFSKNARN